MANDEINDKIEEIEGMLDSLKAEIDKVNESLKGAKSLLNVAAKSDNFEPFKNLIWEIKNDAGEIEAITFNIHEISVRELIKLLKQKKAA